jgi:hypothetical protein
MEAKIIFNGRTCIATKGNIKVEFTVLSSEEIKKERNSAYQYIIP